MSDDGSVVSESRLRADQADDEFTNRHGICAGEVQREVAEAVGRLWEVVIREMGAESDFTSAIKPIEQAAGVVVGGPGAPKEANLKR